MNWNKRYSHDNKHPWPIHIEELIDHLTSHHENFIQSSLNHAAKHSTVPWSRQMMFDHMRKNSNITFNAHTDVHKNSIVPPEFRGPEQHEHDDEGLFDDIPNNISDIEQKHLTTISYKKRYNPTEVEN